MTLKPFPIEYSQEQLELLANQLSLQHWKKTCDIPVVWNGRLRAAMGRFAYTTKGKQRIPLKIELSKYAAQHLNKDTFISVLLHELCHYHLFIEGKPFHDHHPQFEMELVRVGAISTHTVQVPQKAYELFCSHCQKPLGKRKRINTKNYLSACCQREIIKKEIWLGAST